jgi:hypothetical protein
MVNKYYFSCPCYIGNRISIGFAIQFNRRVLFGVDIASWCDWFDSRWDCNIKTYINYLICLYWQSIKFYCSITMSSICNKINFCIRCSNILNSKIQKSLGVIVIIFVSRNKISSCIFHYITIEWRFLSKTCIVLCVMRFSYGSIRVISTSYEFCVVNQKSR